MRHHGVVDGVVVEGEAVVVLCAEGAFGVGQIERHSLYNAWADGARRKVQKECERKEVTANGGKSCCCWYLLLLILDRRSGRLQPDLYVREGQIPRQDLCLKRSINVQHCLLSAAYA